MALFLQIKRHVERLIADGILGPGTKLPATRDLARTLGVNRTTIATAYDALVADGWARAHVGQGTFVADRAAPRPAERPAAGPLAWEGSFSRGVRRLLDDIRRRTGPDVSVGPGLVSFLGASPDPTLFPTEEFRRALNHVIKREGAALLEYHPVAGYAPLRRYLAAWLVRHGIEVREDEVLVVNGSQQGLDLIARALIDPGDVVLIEEPTYPGAIQVFAAAQAELVPVPVGPGGLRVDVAATLIEKHRPKLLYCQPSGQNPTGVSLDPAARLALLDVAVRHRLPIVEDGFGAPGEAEGARAPLRALDRHGLVIHLGTLSKVLFPGLRVGWMVVPGPLAAPLLRIKQLADLNTGALLQAAVFRFCQGRRLERHARLIRAEYRSRRAALLGALERGLVPESAWSVPDESAFSLLLTLPEGVDAAALLPRAIDRGIAYAPGSFFFLGERGARALRLAYAALPGPRIDEGVRRLGDVVREALKHRRRPSVKATAGALPVV
ncbi:MAG: PLP-dependent aminotransferase family protein [Candidatus Rokuibacteriota bacterium]|nr:MAG: PLP-dependent aminotransferase family protein [Candidatus Rokubacteria bacterium]